MSNINDNQEYNTKSNISAIVIKSPEPLPNEMQKIKKLYLVGLLCIIPPLTPIGILGLLILYILDDKMVKVKRKCLRQCKFKFTENINYENLFLTMQPIFVGKYNMLVEKREDGVMMITHNEHIYDIFIQDDNTFTIWWRMSLGKAFLSFGDYNSYRKILASMGIISYEIQKAYNIQ